MTTDDTRRSDGQGRHRLVSLPVDDLLMALNYEGADLEQQDTAPAWRAARDRVLTAIYEPHAYTCPTACVEQNHPGREHDLAARGGNTDNTHSSHYDEDGYCEHCGNGQWKPHAPDCGWADLQDSRAAAWDEGWKAAQQVVELDGVKCWAHTVFPEGHEGNPYRHGDAAPAPTDNQRDDGVAQRVRALADKWIASGDERRYVHDLGRALRAVIDGATTGDGEGA